MILIWSIIKQKYLKGYPIRLKVAKLLIQIGCHVTEGGKIYCGDVELSPVKIARALNADRRVIAHTVKMILDTPELKQLFQNITHAGPSFRNLPKQFNYSVIEVYADANAVGVIAEVTKLVAEQNKSIRQIFAEDPDLQPDPKLIIVLEGELPQGLISNILKVKSVRKVTTY